MWRNLFQLLIVVFVRPTFRAIELSVIPATASPFAVKALSSASLLARPQIARDHNIAAKGGTAQSLGFPWNLEPLGSIHHLSRGVS